MNCVPVKRNISDNHSSIVDFDLNDKIREYVENATVRTFGLFENVTCFTRLISCSCTVSHEDFDNSHPSGQYLITGISYSKR